MGSKSQLLLNPQQALFEDQDHQTPPISQMGFFNFPSNPFENPNFSTSNNNNNNSDTNLNLSETLLFSSMNLPLKPSPFYEFAPPHLLSLQTSTPNLWWVPSNTLKFLKKILFLWMILSLILCLKAMGRDWEEKQWKSIGNFNNEDEEDQRKKKSSRAKIFIQNPKRCGCSWWWLQMAEVWPESCQEHTASSVNKNFKKPIFCSFDSLSFCEIQILMFFIMISEKDVIIRLQKHQKGEWLYEN